MKKYISYRGNKGIASSLQEAIEIICSFYDPDIQDYLQMNDICLGHMEKIFSDENAPMRKVFPTNCGSRGVLISKAQGDTVEEHLSAIRAVNILDEHKRGIETKLNRRNLSYEMNEHKDGVYSADIVLVYAINGKTKRYRMHEEIIAHSILNAYNKAVDMAADYCHQNGYEFVMVKELLSKYTKIEWIKDE